jgi:hypothetical protein
MIGQNTAHTFAWSEADSLMPISWQCSARASWVLKAGWAPFAYGSSVLFRWEDSCHRCCKSLSSCRRTTPKLFSCKELPWEDTRTWSADIPTQDSITNLFLIFYYVINIILSECTQSETPFHVAVVHSSAASTSQCQQIYIIGLVPSTIVHGIMPHLFEKQETTKQCNLGTRALAHCASLTERPSVGSWRGSPTNNKPVLKSGKRQKPNSLS